MDAVVEVDHKSPVIGPSVATTLSLESFGLLDP